MTAIHELTVGEWLLDAVQWIDFRELPSIQEQHAQPGWACDCQGCLSEGALRKQLHLAWINAWYGPGMSTLRVIAEADGEQEGVTVEWFKRRRSDLIIAGANAPDVDKLKISEFIDALRPKPAATASDSVDATTEADQPGLGIGALQELLGDHGEEILGVATSDLPADDRMRRIYAIDSRVLGWDSPKWSRMLGVSASRVRQTEWWIRDRKELSEKRRDEYSDGDVDYDEPASDDD